MSPGDELWDHLGSDTPRGTRDLAEHWAVKSVVGQIARALSGVDCFMANAATDGLVRVSDSRGADMLRPHIKRIALDVLRFGQFVAVIATDSQGGPRELVPLPGDEAQFELQAGQIIKGTLGTQEWQPDKLFVVAEELPARSPLESLRGILEEDLAASQWRKAAWRTSPRALVKRGLDAPEWNKKARERFQASLRGQMMEESPRGSGMAGFPVVEDGMDVEPLPLPDAQAAQFLEARKATLEIVADVYGVQGSLFASGADKQIGPARVQLLRGPVSDLAGLITQAYSVQLAQKMYGNVNGRNISTFFDLDGAAWKEAEDPQRTSTAVQYWRTVNEQRALEGREPIDGGDRIASPQPKAVVTQ